MRKTRKFSLQQSYEALSIAQKVNLLFSALTVSEAASAVGEEGRQLAAVMLRRILSSDFDEFYPKVTTRQTNSSQVIHPADVLTRVFFSYAQLPPEQQAQFKSDLLVLIQQEPNKQVRRKVADLVAEVARNLVDDDGNNLWPEFLRFLFNMASSQNPGLKEISLHLFR